MLYALSRAMQLFGLLLLPLAMVMQLNGMRLGNMLLMAGVGVAVFFVGYLLQQHVTR